MPAPPESPAVKLYNQGAEHFKKGEVDQAIGFFQKAAEADKDFYRAWAYLGMAYAQKGQLDPAIEAYRKCIDIAPQYHKAFNNVGELYRRKGLLDYAAMVFKMATEIEPKLPHYFYNLGITYFEIGMYAQAEDAFGHAAKLDPNDFEYATELAQVQFTQKKYEAAAETMARFNDAHPEHERAPETRARLAMLRRLAEAQKAVSNAMDTGKVTARKVELDEDENSQTKVVEPLNETPPQPYAPAPPPLGQDDPPRLED
jgi:Flp pilus assembly protein TadD